jgi:membrane fusion protein (multidrug efflux system)
VELDNARFTYEQSQASYEQQKLQVENLTIRAPIDGVVTHRMIQEGMLVSSGAPVFRIVDPSSYQLAIYPSEQDLLKLREGQVAEVSFDALPGQEFEARVERINPAIDPENQRVKVVLGLEEAVRQQLAEGGLARVRLVVDVREDALLVPKDAIIEESGREYVFTIEERPVDPENAPDDAALETGTQLVAKRLPVETGLEEGPRIEVKAGIEPDRPIVTLGREALREGSPVRITTSEEELEAAADVDFDEALEQAAKKRDEGAHTVPDRH